MIFPTLETERLLLRRLRPDDANEVFMLRSNALHNQYIARPLALTIEDAEVFITKIESIVNAGEGCYWAIVLKDQRTLAGTIGLWSFDEKNSKAELGYELLGAYQGRGIMSEALEKVLQFGFTELRLSKIEAWTHPGNSRSSALLKKMNFTRDFEAEKSKPTGAAEVIYSLYSKDYLH